MDYLVQWEPIAVKDMRSLPRNVQEKVGEHLDKLAHGFQGDIIKMKGERDRYRLRVGRYRILFKLEGNRVVVYRIRTRGDAYLKFLW